jgi:hypothetical protein
VIERLRMVACPESDGLWTFHLLNQSDDAVEAVVVKSVDYEWGDSGSSESPGKRTGAIPAGGSAEVWRGDDGEMRLDVVVTVTQAGQHTDVTFSFGKIYRRRDSLDVIPGFDRAGILARPS